MSSNLVDIQLGKYLHNLLSKKHSHCTHAISTAVIRQCQNVSYYVHQQGILCTSYTGQSPCIFRCCMKERIASWVPPLSLLFLPIFLTSFDPSNPCTYHYLCPCNKCIKLWLLYLLTKVVIICCFLFDFLSAVVLSLQSVSHTTPLILIYFLL